MAGRSGKQSGEVLLQGKHSDWVVCGDRGFLGHEWRGLKFDRYFVIVSEFFAPGLRLLRRVCGDGEF